MAVHQAVGVHHGNHLSAGTVLHAEVALQPILLAGADLQAGVARQPEVVLLQAHILHRQVEAVLFGYQPGDVLQVLDYDYQPVFGSQLHIEVVGSHQVKELSPPDLSVSYCAQNVT